jgi:peroxiredoxin (alkyl hydroperoxide reductase subunit C)
VLGVDGSFGRITNEAFKSKWTVLFTWPFDFTFVCPTEILAFNDLAHEFQNIECQLFGMSIDSVFAHEKWQKELDRKINFPWLSDTKRELSTVLGILDPVTGATYRATYILDPARVVRSVSINDLVVGRNPNETLRLVQAFQTGKLCGCNWQPGESTLD